MQSTNETVFGKNDGSITAVDSTMEYRKEGDSTYTAITGNTVEDLAAGKYYVRVKGDSNHNPSPDTEVTVLGVVDDTAPALFGIENGGIYYGDKIFKATDDNFLKIEVDGIDITDTTEGDDEYKIVADNAEHTVTVTDKAGNITEYKITVYKQYTVTFMDENGVYKTVTVNHGEKAEMPEAPKKDGYTVTWEKELGTVTADVTVKAVYTRLAASDTDFPQTGDSTNLWLWFALLSVSGGTVFATALYGKKRNS